MDEINPNTWKLRYFVGRISKNVFGRIKMHIVFSSAPKLIKNGFWCRTSYLAIGRELAFYGSSNGKSPGHLPVSIMLVRVPNASPPLDTDIPLF